MTEELNLDRRAYTAVVTATGPAVFRVRDGDSSFVIDNLRAAVETAGRSAGAALLEQRLADGSWRDLDLPTLLREAALESHLR